MTQQTKREQAIEILKEAFKVAREEGALTKYADGESDALDVLGQLESLGYISPDELEKWAKGHGYVCLAQNQRLPKSNLGRSIFGEPNSAYKEGMDNMGKLMLTPKDGTVWKKVETEDKEPHGEN